MKTLKHFAVLMFAAMSLPPAMAAPNEKLTEIVYANSFCARGQPMVASIHVFYSRLNKKQADFLRSEFFKEAPGMFKHARTIYNSPGASQDLIGHHISLAMKRLSGKVIFKFSKPFMMGHQLVVEPTQHTHANQCSQGWIETVQSLNPMAS